MSDPTILFVKPKAIRPSDKRALRDVGVVVVEVADPQSVKFTRAFAEIDSNNILLAAMRALNSYSYGNDPRVLFTKVLTEAFTAAYTPPIPKTPEDTTP